MPDDIISVRMLTREQAKTEQRLYWSRKSVPERIAAASALTQRMNAMRGFIPNDENPDLTPRRIPRPKR